MASTPKTELNIVMGAMTFGEGVRVDNLNDAQTILDEFRAHGHAEIDTARMYAGGTSEQYLGKLDLESKGFVIQTKLYPIKNPALGALFTHDAEGLRKGLLESLEALNLKSLSLWYLHGPDRAIPYEVTLKAVNDLYKEGYFKALGLSNYASWEVAEIVTICKANGYIVPTVYQGIYNAALRTVEPELFPALRKYGIKFYAFNPLGGGFFTGRYKSMDGEVEAGSRYDPSKYFGLAARSRYWKQSYFDGLAKIQEVATKHGLTMTEIALRWISHHSMLKREYNDAVIIGASSLKHVRENLEDLEKGPLPEEVVAVLDEVWLEAKPHAAAYFH